MNRHITEIELGRYASSLSSGDEELFITGHLVSCHECARACNLILEGGSLKGEAPSAVLRQRVLDSFGTVKQSPVDRRVKFINKAVITTAGLFAAAAAIFFILNGFFMKVGTDLPPIVAVRSGNEQIIRLNKTGLSLKTEDISMKISVNEICEITVLKETDFNIDSYSEKDNKLKFMFTVNDGKIISKFSHNRPVSYSFTTPHAVISSTGTELLIESAKASTTLIVKSGEARITSRSTQELARASTGYRYTVTDSIAAEKAVETDYSMFLDTPLKEKNPSSLQEINLQTVESEKGSPAVPAQSVSEDKTGTVRERNSGELHQHLREEKREIRETRKESRKDKRESREKRKKNRD